MSDIFENRCQIFEFGGQSAHIGIYVKDVAKSSCVKAG